MVNFSLDFSSDGVNEFLIRKGSTFVPPPSGINLIYVGSTNIADLKYYNGAGVNVPITAVYVGSTLVWEP